MNEGLMIREGIVDDDRERELVAENRDLRAALAQARAEARQATQDAQRALGSLRKQLGPLYRALQDVFGELDTAGVEDTNAAPTSSRTSAVWESWKSKMPGRPAQVIDALLLHGAMNSTQIGINIGIHRNNVPPLIHRLHKAGLIDKNGNKYALKSL